MTNSVQQALETYTIDPLHSRLGFTVRHMGFSKVRGSFETFEGTVWMEPGDLSTLETSATVQTKSVTTNADDRDAHLRSADFFDAENHPAITFRSTDVRDVSGNSFILVGELTIRGVTREVVLTGEFLGEGKDPWGNTRIGFEARTQINRKEFGLNWNAVLEAGGFLVGDEVDIELEIQALRQQEG